MTQTQQKVTVEVRKVIIAPVDRVFKAWTEPDQLSKWLGGGAVAGVRAEQDVRVGGNYRVDFDYAGCEGKSGFMTGIYKEVVPNKKLVFTWTNSSDEFPAKDTVVTVEFIARDKGTEVIIKHTNFIAQATADRHNNGWEQSLEKLASLVA